jgi:hypothetical protein
MPKSKKRTRVQYGLQKKKITKKKTRRQKRRTQKRRKRHGLAFGRRHHVLFGGFGFEVHDDKHTKGQLKEDVAIRDFLWDNEKKVKDITAIAVELTVDPDKVLIQYPLTITNTKQNTEKQYLRIQCETRNQPFLILSNLSKPTFTPYEDALDFKPYSNDSS